MKTEQQNIQAVKFGLPHVLLIVVLSGLLCGEAYFGYHLKELSAQQEQIKEDYSTKNSITFGLFSIDKWSDKLSAVVNGQVSDFTITPAQKRALQTNVEQQLNGLVNQQLANIKKPKKTLMGRIKKFAVEKFVDEDKVHALVPVFAKTIVDKVSSPASTDRLKGIVTSKLTELEDQTYDSTQIASDAVTAFIYKKYKVTTDSAFNQQVSYQLRFIRTMSYNYVFGILGCVLLALVIWLLMRRVPHLQTTFFFMSLLFALVLLWVGITSSIIEVDARLKVFDFSILNNDLAFNNQVLFFQSKSIMGIIETLVRQSKPDAALVGSLILLFVVILPIVRIIAKGIHIVAGRSLAENKAVKYFAFDSAKWDMADVMVVGILMTYIGLNGILKNELSDLEFHTRSLESTTLNATSLQAGYFIFVGYVIFTFILAYVLNRLRPRDERTARQKRWHQQSYEVLKRSK